MKPWGLDQIRRVTLSRWLNKSQRNFSGRVVHDHRNVAEGDLFVAIRGARFDGHTFIGQAIAAGAAAVLVDSTPGGEAMRAATEAGAAVLQCDQSVRGLNRLAAGYRQEIRAKVIAVGGSNGKTTTKRLIDTVLAAKLTGHASPKSFNNNIGLPLTLLQVEPQHEYVVLEVGTNAPGEVAALGEVAAPDIAVITSVGLEHLEHLGDLKSIAAEEASLVRFVRDGGMLFFPNNVPELTEALKLSTLARVTVGVGGSGADLEAAEVVESVDGLNFKLNGRLAVHVPLLGRHNVMNILPAIGVARRMGLADEQIVQGLGQCQPAPMRMEPLRINGHFVLNDAYNANPTSMAGALETFGRIELGTVVRQGVRRARGAERRRGCGQPPRRVAILADMLELGQAGPEMHEWIGSLVVENRMDMLIAVGPQMQTAAALTRRHGVATEYFATTAAAVRGVPALLRRQDAVLLKGSRGMHLEEVLEAIKAAEVSVPAAAPEGAVD
ncbi:MAG: UDP-N-acetylmuramoyl-tripeptide--D-alanyl-D-alanine ligase [Phycisphaerae bacterium]|nr:UDP-N-acetylmuramoyl-tripeptide--D-alanyl-D-alanine ligase [Phycisphaerae bacterium]